MASQQGFIYEQNAAQILKMYGLVSKNFHPACASSDQPDLMLTYNQLEKGCELKKTPAPAGSLVLKYDISDSINPWKFGSIDFAEKEKLLIKELAEKQKVFDRIRAEWKHIPYKRDRDSLWESTAGLLSAKERYRRDLSVFPEIKDEIDPTLIEEYYNKKHTYYVNIGTHGFFLLGKKNPFKLKNVQRFASAAKAYYRTRVQYKGKDNYQFTFEFSFKMLTKSFCNIAPVKGKTATIDESRIDLSVFGK